MSFEEGDPGDKLRPPRQQVDAEDGAPVVTDHDQILQAGRVDEPVEVAAMVAEPVLEVRLRRAAHPDQVQGQTAAALRHRAEDVAPQV